MHRSFIVIRTSLLAIVIGVVIFSGSVTARAITDNFTWEQVAPGIEYTKIQLPDPNNVFVARMDRSNLSVTIESTIAKGALSQGRETVSGMYNRYNQVINYWGGSANPSTWGKRNQSVVAINGSYFDWASGLPQGGQIQSGWYAKRYDDYGGWSGFAWKIDRTAFIGECVYHDPAKQLITYPSTGNTQLLTKINSSRGANELVMFTPQYNSRTGTDNDGVEVLVEMRRPVLILPLPNNASGTIRQVFISSGNNWIPFNSIVLSASGAVAQTLLENAQVGKEISVSQEIASYNDDCSTSNTLSWTKTYASIQGAFYFLRNGQIRDFNDPGATERNPRTAIAYNDQYIYFIVVDGRDAQHSFGMSIHELAVFARDILGASSAVAQDGGGSSTMVINGKVVNNTICNIYSCNYENVVYLPIVQKNYQPGTVSQAAVIDIVTSDAGTERAVGNGMLMVSVQPEDFSIAFLPGDAIATQSDTSLRLGPGVNYASLAIIPSGTPGTIQNQANGLNGVQATSSYWWYVTFNGLSGWVTESSIIRN